MKALPGLKKPFPISPALQTVVHTLSSAGGRVVAVGGCVRDHLLGTRSKDIDLEIYNLSAVQLEESLSKVAKVYSVGKNFGVLKVNMGDESFDIALPRRENKEGQGHRGFQVKLDPTFTFAEASLRRDFTINAIGIDLPSQELLDPNGGINDLHCGILRHVSAAFREDPLRVLRACQFAARLNLFIHPDTIRECQSLSLELRTLSSERIYEEMMKLFRSERPSIGLKAIRETNALVIFPELAALIDCPQDPHWHPEGDVWIHSLMVVDEAAWICRREKLDIPESMLVILGALCHDFGKPGTTRFEDGRWRSKGHESAGEEPTRHFLTRMGVSPNWIEEIVPLVKEHLKPFQLYAIRDTLGNGAIRRLAIRVPIWRLSLVSEADFLGRTTTEALKRHDPATQWLRNLAASLEVQHHAPKPLLLGRHLMEFHVRPGPQMGKILDAAFDAQLEGSFATLEEGKTWLRHYLSEHGHKHGA